MQWKQSDFFEGLRKLPRSPEELFGHRNKLNCILQKRYLIPPDMVELALNKQGTEQFNRCYSKLVTQAISKFNSTSRSQLKVRVDPRLPKGMQLIRPDSKETSAQSKVKGSGKVAVEGSNTFGITSSPHQRRQLQQSRYCSPQSGGTSPRVVMPIDPAERDCLYSAYLGARTPQSTASDITDMLFRTPGCATEGKATVLSDEGYSAQRSTTRRSAAEVCFATPPAFKGFDRTLEMSPADSPTGNSVHHF